MKRWLVILGLACCCLGFLTPAYQGFLLGAAGSLSLGVLWLGLLAANLFVGAIACVLAIPSGRSRGLVIARSFILAAAGLLLLVHVFNLTTITYARLIGPKATMVLPNGYSGTIGLHIHDLIEPGGQTAGETYAYKIPSSGTLEMDSGWIALRFRYDPKGFSMPDFYATQVIWENGTPLRFAEFSCKWVQDSWMEPMADHSLSSRSKTLGIACNIKPGADRQTEISHVAAERFFRDHFVVQRAQK